MSDGGQYIGHYDDEMLGEVDVFVGDGIELVVRAARRVKVGFTFEEMRVQVNLKDRDWLTVERMISGSKWFKLIARVRAYQERTCQN